MHIASTLRSPFLWILILVMGGISARAQVRFSTVASSKQMGRTDYFQLEFVVENAHQIENLNQPDIPDFQIISGPNQSTGMTIVNGSVSQYKTVSFILQPTKTGKFTIPGATAIIDGKKMQSNSVTIQVDAGGSSAGHNQPPSPPIWPGEEPEYQKDYLVRPGEDVNEKIRKNLFVKILVSKTSCYVGEPIVATYKLYSRLQSESRVTRHPSLNGFSVYDMVDPAADNSSVENVNGKPFAVHIIRKAQLIPLQAGNVALDPVELENTVHFLKAEAQQHKRSNNPLQELFDRFAGTEEGERIEQHVTLESKPVEISVKPLPAENRPADFNGAVGKFSMNANLESKNIVAEDAATLKLTVKGTGNLPVVNAPNVNWPEGIEDYAANAREEIDKSVAPMNGLKTFEYKFIPSRSGNFEIPSISFSYFDPVSATYKLLMSEPLSFVVKPGLQHKSNRTSPIKEDSTAKFSSGMRRFINDHLEWIFGSLMLAGLAVFLLFQNQRAKKISLEKKLAEQEAQRKALEALALEKDSIKTDPLMECRNLLAKGYFAGFYSELNRALWNELAEKLKIRASNLNKQHITLGLHAAGWAEDEISMLQHTLNECEVKLYTPDHDESDLQRILKDAEMIISRLDSHPRV
jgi:BatD DUF11 like domain